MTTQTRINPETKQVEILTPEGIWSSQALEQQLSNVGSQIGALGQAINSEGISPVNETPFVSPEITPMPSVNYNTYTAPPLEETPTEGKAQTLTERLQELNQSLVGESAYRAEQETTQDIAGLTKTRQDLTNQLKILQNEAQQIPLQLQQEATGRGVTAGGLAPLQTARLRTNAIAALGVSAMLEASNGNLATANDLVDRAVAAEFDPIREEINAATANLKLILESPDYTREEKNRAQAQLDIQNAQKTKIEKEEQITKDINAIALESAKNGATSDVLNNILNSSSLFEAIKYAGESLGAEFRNKAIQQDFENRIKIEELSIEKAKARADVTGLSSFQQTKVQTIANQFDSEQAVKNYQTSAEAIDALKYAGDSPTDDISRIYVFAKVMDPNSVVREGEYKTVQDYSTALLERIGLKAKRIFNNEGFLTDEARKFMEKTLTNRLSSSEKAYQNIYSEYGRRIDKITGSSDGKEYLTDYSRAFISESDEIEIISPDGTEGTIPKSQLEEALKQGYKQK